MPSYPGDSAEMAPPLPVHSVGRTFLVAISLLGLVAVCQIGALLWRVKHPMTAALPQSLAVPHPVTTASAKVAASPSPSLSETDPLAAEAEKRLLASLPRPTPVPVRRSVTPEARVDDLVNLARALRDRGDTSTALTRLREAQVISPRNLQIVSEMAITYEKMGLIEKALQQWRRIYEMGEKAGIYYAAAEAKMRAFELPPADTPTPAPSLTGDVPLEGGAQGFDKILYLGQVGTVDDTGNSQSLRRLKLRVPIFARPGGRVSVRDAVIQVYFYEKVKDGSIVETNANVASSWISAPVDWAGKDPEELEVEYSQAEPDPLDPRSKEHRNYFGYIVRVYYKRELNAVFAEPARLLKQFPPPATLPSLEPATLPNSDLPQ